MRLLLSMGIKRDARASTPLSAVLRELDGSSGRILRDFHWESTDGWWPGGEEPCTFTASWLGDRLVVPSRTELLFFDPVQWRLIDVWSHRLFTDLHSVTPAREGWWLTASGHDSVLRVVDGDVVEVRSLRDGEPADRDWRRIPADALKPHAWHPNYAQSRPDGLWVTAFEPRAALNLDTGERLELPEGPPHDGILREGRWWFTTVTGHVVAFDPDTHERVLALDLNELLPSAGLVGWCRGLEVVGDRLFVGFTMLRRSRWREALGWAARGPKQPTRVVEIDLRGPTFVRAHEVGNQAGGCIYAIHARPD